MNNARFCNHCGDVLNGRSDKKFCDDQCRNNFNNKINSVDLHEIRSINNILKRNRRILSEMVNGSVKVKVNKHMLYEKGFNFLYHTHISAEVNGTVYKVCYDYGYQSMASEEVIVLKCGKLQGNH